MTLLSLSAGRADSASAAAMPILTWAGMSRDENSGATAKNDSIRQKARRSVGKTPSHASTSIALSPHPT